jgi:hypothetical protein
MSKLNTNAKLGIVVVVLGALAGLKAAMGSRYGDEDTVNASAPLFAAFKKEQVERLLIEGPDSKKVELVKSGEAWTVATESGGKADQALIDKALGAIEKLKQGLVVSSSGDPVAYSVDGPKAIQVTVWGAGGPSSAPVAKFALGKAEDDYRNCFLKLPGEPAIRTVEASIGDFSPTTGDTWRDKTLYAHGEAEKVLQVEVAGPNGVIVVQREKVMGEKPPANGAAAEGDAKPADPAAAKEVKEVVWNVVAPKEGRAKKWLCDSLAGYAAKLECSAFHSGTEKAADLGLDPPQYTLRARFEGEAASKDVLLLGNKGKDGKYACMVPGQQQISWIEGWKGEYLTKSVDDLLDAPPPAAPKEAPPAEPAKDDGAKSDEAAKPADDGATPPATDPPKPADGSGGGGS